MWKPIVGYEGVYEVSDCGEVKSLDRVDCRGNYLKSRKMRLSNSTKGYKGVGLHMQGVRASYQVHRLVASAFLPNVQNKPQVNHIDGDKANNNLANLEWCTNGENQIHAFANGLNKSKIGSEHYSSKLTELEAQYAIWWLEAGMTCRDVAKTIDIKEVTISKIKQKRSWKHLHQPAVVEA